MLLDMRTEFADNPVGVVLSLLAVIVGAALIVWGWNPSTGNGAALIVVGVVLVAYAAFRFYTNFLQD
jgi:hypothetical protein